MNKFQQVVIGTLVSAGAMITGGQARAATITPPDVTGNDNATLSSVSQNSLNVNLQQALAGFTHNVDVDVFAKTTSNEQIEAIFYFEGNTGPQSPNNGPATYNGTVLTGLRTIYNNTVHDYGTIHGVVTGQSLGGPITYVIPDNANPFFYMAGTTGSTNTYASFLNGVNFPNNSIDAAATTVGANLSAVTQKELNLGDFAKNGVIFKVAPTITDTPIGSPVPEPTSIALTGIGLAGLGYKKRKGIAEIFSSATNNLTPDLGNGDIQTLGLYEPGPAKVDIDEPAFTMAA